MNFSLFVLFFILIFLDRISKYYIYIYLKPISQIKLLPGILNLRYIENSGAAFGIFSNQKVFLALLTVVAFFVIFNFFSFLDLGSNSSNNKVKYCLVFIFSGAISNFYDRIFKGYVVDFLDFAFVDFPVFNFADIFLTVGCIILFFVVICKK